MLSHEARTPESMDTKPTQENPESASLRSGDLLGSAAVRRYSHQTGRHYYACLHDPTVVNPKPCAFFEALPPGHPFAGFCRYNMARQDSQSPDDFGDLCHSSRAVEALRKPNDADEGRA